ncbi:MAG: hypothetical protein M9887_07890 [Chitinophagales bacterium]|nr:hypothetical protein [Chitinophagales bacterium]
MEKEDGYIAIEIKKGEHIRENDARNFNSLQEVLDKPVLHNFILSNDIETKHFDDKTSAIHAAYFLM